MTEFVVGAYASMPADEEGQDSYYSMLADTGFVTGIEVPFPGQLADQHTRSWLGRKLEGRFTHSIVTAIPGTMVNVWDDPRFGLASPNDMGRDKAIAFTHRIYEAVEDLHDQHGHIFDYVAIHSAPTKVRELEPFITSLKEITSWNWGSTKILIEHCDAFTPDHAPEKGFLTLAEELKAAQQAAVSVSINWGRIAVEARNGTAPTDAIQTAQASGLLAGIIFSGASPKETIYGGPWADGHLPLSLDEDTSLMTPEAVADGVTKAGAVKFLGAKCCVPKDATLTKRLSMITNIARAAGVTK